MSDMPANFRELLARPGLTDVIGCHDVISAKLIEQAGFAALHLGGSAVSAANFGLPDVGVVSIVELIDHARRVTAAVDIPVSIDLDDGGGTATRVYRAVQLAEQAGVGALRIEDIDFNSGKHFMNADLTTLSTGGDQLRPAAEFAEFIAAACEARRNPDMLIIARTEAVELASLEEAISRANLYADSGADVVFCGWLKLDDVKRVASEIPVPLLYLHHNPTRTEWEKLQADGAKLLNRPSVTYAVAFRAIRDTLRELAENKELPNFERPAYADTAGAVDGPKWRDIAARHGMISQ